MILSLVLSVSSKAVINEFKGNRSMIKTLLLA